MSAPEDNLPEADRLAVGLARLVDGLPPSNIMAALTTLMAGLILRGSKNKTLALGEVAGRFADINDQIKAHYAGCYEHSFTAPVPIPAGVRPEVAAFALRMEARLRENDHKGGWYDEKPLWLADRALRCAGKLSAAMDRVIHDHVGGLEANRAAVLRAACDTANYAMMAADNVTAGGLVGKPKGDAA